MNPAQRQLDLIATFEDALDSADTVQQACDAMAKVVLLETSVTEAVVITPDLVDRTMGPGEQGRQDVSEELRQAARMVRRPGEEWGETTFDDVTIRALRARGKRLASVLVRSAASLRPEDMLVLDLLEARGARLLAHALDKAALVERNLELATIYEIDHIRDEHLPFEEMLQRIMSRMLEIVSAQAAVIALKHVHEDSDLKLFVRNSGSYVPGLEHVLDAPRSEIEAAVWRALDARKLTEETITDGGVRATMTMPLLLEDEVLGAFTLVGKQGRNFTHQDRRLFKAVCSQTDTAIFEDVRRQRLKATFKRYVSRDVFEEMLNRDEDFLSGRRREVTCFFSDLRGFTSVSEQLDVDVVVDMLNEHLSAMTDVVFEHGGTVDKFIGDCVMAFFGAPLPQDDHAQRAVRAAVAMRKRHDEICAGWVKRGLPEVKIGIGMHTGSVFVGPIGGEQLSSYTIIGDNVNQASRLEGMSGPDDIIISGQTLEQVEGDIDVEPRGEIVVRGKTVPVQIFNVKDCR